jgi:8-oxo-dGTP diphosphatase
MIPLRDYGLLAGLERGSGMRWEEQGVDGAPRHVVIPRTLCFLRWQDEVLLLRGAATKRIWAGKWNGIGGHIEVGETPLKGAKREILEETGLVVHDLRLAAILHIYSRETVKGIMIFVYVGNAPSREISPGPEGVLQWFSVEALPQEALVADLPELIPLVLEAYGDTIIYGLYQPDEQGHMTFQFIWG